MSEKDEPSTTKITSGLEEAEGTNQCGKRGREGSLEPLDTESPRKMRKKSPLKNGAVKLIEKVKQDAAAMNATVLNGSGSNTEKEIDKNFGIENDSALLNDLLGDFSEDDSDATAISSKQNGSNGSQDASVEKRIITEKTSNGATDSSEQLLESEFDGDFDDFFDDIPQEDEDKITEEGIDFLEFTCCKIVDINNEKLFTRIKVEQFSNEKTATVLCYGFWRNTKIEVNDVVSIKAAKISEKWTIDNDNGFLVTQPHTLISGTSVVGANFCFRRGVLVESFRGLDALPDVENDCAIMVIGTLVHETLQNVLRRKLTTIVEIRKVVEEIINSQRGIKVLYESNLTQKECKQKIEPYVPKIFHFVKRYITGTGSHVKDDNFTGKIERIREIEENVWVPAMGLKGKIDVTVDVTVNAHRKIMPLEVKTGQPSFSPEHRGQLIIYNMMLGFIGHKVDAGLLLYIRDNVLKEVKSKRPEERDLIMLRNSLAYYLTREPELVETAKEDGSVEKVWKDTELPEPINHRMACPKCPYNILCSVYAEKDPNLKLSESHILNSIKKDTAEVLTPEHIDYVLKWIVMTKLEATSNEDNTSLRNIWIMEPRKREKKGFCISNLEVSGKVKEEGNSYLHTFVRKNPDDLYSETEFSCTSLTESDFIIVSTDTRINVSVGHITSQSGKSIEMLLDRNIVKQNPNATFHLDKYPFGSLSKLSLANIACLLNIHDITNKLRGIIIDKNPATFVSKLPRSIAELGAPILFRLNKHQREAVLKVLAAKDYLLIKGMPGTGKTQTLIGLIELLVKMNRSVLITAHTNSAVDNIMLKLDEKGIDFLRLGSTRRLHPKLKNKAEDVLTANYTTVESLDAFYNSKKIVGVTCFGATHVLLSKRIFDVCLVDESTQVLQSTVLKPIFSAKTFVLVGDPEQLPPLVRNVEAKKMGMDESLFRRLDSDENTVTLKLQYRMNRKIMSIANELTYNGAMTAGTDIVAKATLRLTDTMVLESCERWISKTLSPNIEDSVVMLNTGQTCELRDKFLAGTKYAGVDNKRLNNVLEATIVLRIVEVLLKGGIEPKSIGVISPYIAQVELLSAMCEENVEINTVDQYQGRDKDVILYSCARSETTSSYVFSEHEVLQCHQRLNVALTRAKHKLIIIGDQITLNRYASFRKLISFIKEDIINLEPGRDNFSWESLVQLIK